MQLDISNSNFETVVDEISSGLDPAGSNYIVTSSYPNGNLVREGGRGSIVRSSTPTTTTSYTSTTTTTTASVPTTSSTNFGTSSSSGGSGTGGGGGY